MNRTLIVLVFAIPTFALAGILEDVRREHASQAKIAEIVATADSARVRGEMEPESAGVLIRDTAWIKTVSDALARGPLGRRGSCLCSGWQTAYFYRDGKLVASMAAIHENQLRIAWSDGSGDFPIDEARWASVKAALAPPVD